MEGEQTSSSVSAPNSVNYGDQLPLGIEAKSQKRLFFPTTGDTYTPGSNTICRIDVNYDGLLDTQQSFLEFDLQNTSANTCSFDLGQPVIKKLTISSGGVVLEEIHDYNSLIAGVLLPSQAGPQNIHYEAANNNAIDFERGFANIAAGAAPCAVGAIAATAVADDTNGYATPNQAEIRAGVTEVKNRIVAAVAADLATARGVINTAVTNSVVAGVNAGGANVTGNGAPLRYAEFLDGDAGSTALTRRGRAATTQSFKQQYKLVSGLLDNDKYLPLVLMNAGITIEFELAPAVEAMVGTAPDYSITNVRYVSHLIDLERSFYDRLRMVQQQSGGVLQIAGQSYRSFRTTLDAGVVQSNNCPARVRSIKSFFFCAKRAAAANEYGLSSSGNMSLTQFQLAIGATRYPPTANECEVAGGTNKVGAYTELVKAFGKVGSNIHNDLMMGTNAYPRTGANGEFVEGQTCSFAPYGIDLEAFRHEIENGIDTSSRALPITLHTQHAADPRGADGVCNQLLMYVLYDSLFYINMDGSVSVSN
jgi:hypothetical protein|tara:strand:- start:1718 stop:3319 length:1602 start_codon:yes stop_codon:yes gene_type:complete